MDPVDMVEHTERLYAVVRRELGGGLISRTPEASGFPQPDQIIGKSTPIGWCSRRFASELSIGFLLNRLNRYWFNLFRYSECVR